MLAELPYQIYPCGDHAVTIELGDSINVETHQKITALFQHLSKEKITGIKDIIPAYHTLTVVYDLASIEKKDTAVTLYEMMRNNLEKAFDTVAIATTPNRQIQIPVCYDGSLAPDIASLAEAHGVSVDDVVRLHAGKMYRVYMIGFLPGFAYMGSVDEKINTPRRSQPRVSVPAGSVGIAGEQTGIYPFDSPGGWQIIGQTPLSMFDASQPQPCYLQPGDEVQFYAITLAEFEKLKKA
jgi:inhibitor of KinA